MMLATCVHAFCTDCAETAGAARTDARTLCARVYRCLRRLLHDLYADLAAVEAAEP